MSVLRPLPARPSLEYARKEAKSLLRLLQNGDRDAFARARACRSGLRSSRSNLRLADAQLVVAREHGFASWPRLVRYMGDVERQQQAHVRVYADRSRLEADAQSLLAQHRARAIVAGRMLAAFVPRFYGLSIDDVLSSDVHEDEARLAVARFHAAPSWEVLLERAEQSTRTGTPAWETDPMRHAMQAMASADVSALERVVAAHSDLLNPSEADISSGRTLMLMALGQEKTYGVAAMQPVMAWLAERGFDRQRELDLRLCGHVWMSVDEVNDLLDRGANPNAVAPNGIPVLEHALLRYWNGDAVDVLAARTTASDAFWIAAGLGNVDRVSRFLDRHGKPTRAAHRFRPDFVAAGARGFMPQLPDPDDEEVLFEAMLVATLNGRTHVLEYLASRGVPVNSLIYGTPLITIAAANAMTAAAECLVRCGADIDLRGWNMSGHTAREIARELFLQRLEASEPRRILEVFGMDPDVILAERDAQPPSKPVFEPNLRRALMFAEADAAHLGLSDVGLENLLFGLLRNEQRALYFVKEAGRMEVERFHSEMAQRLGSSERTSDDENLPVNAEAQAALDAAVTRARARRSEAVGELELLQALLREENGAAGGVLTRYGVDVARVSASLDELIGAMGPSRVFRKGKP